MLEELCKKDKEWRKMARYICNCKTKGDDLVQDFYIKFANYTKLMNDTTVFFCLKNMFIDNYRKKKIETIELIDNYITFDNDYDFDNDYFKQTILNQIEDLPYFERKLLKETQIISQRKLALETEIPFIIINQNIKKTKVKLWQDLKKLKDLAT